MLTREDMASNVANGILLRQRIRRMPEFQRVGARPKAEFYAALGAHYFQLGRMAEARESFLSAIRLSPLSARPYALLGLTALGKSGYDFALALYRGARSHRRPIEA
jgi:Flp pilus assembly protein TadD